MKLTLTNSSFLITIKNRYLCLNSNSCVSVTIQNETHILVNFFLTITYDITFHGIYLSS
jgi:hypothetical protein